MPRVRMVIENWREMKDYIKSLEDQGKSLLDEVAKAGAEFAQPLIKESVSRIDPELASTVRIKKSRRKSKVKSSAIVEVGGKKKSAYAFHLETGHGRDKNSAARPFLRPTVDSNARAIAEHMKEVFIQKVEVLRNG